jgi:type II secretory pathway pseudopilin PulG
MNIRMNSTRAGITLMEVLISIGILAVGLTAVITIIPAAGSQAQKALTESTKANAGLAAMDDAITRGILTLSPNAIPCVVDPIGNNAFAGLGIATLDGLTGVAADEVFRSQDDLLYSLQNSGQDDPPQPVFYFVDGNNNGQLDFESADANGNGRFDPTEPVEKRMSEGIYSWLATLVPAGGENYQMSVISFHRREVSTPVPYLVDGVVGSNAVFFKWTGSRAAFRDTFPRGTVVLVHVYRDNNPDNTNDDFNSWEWRRVVFPSYDETKQIGQLMFSADISNAAGIRNVYAFKGAVGVAERIVRLEGTSPWTQ